MDYPDFLTSTGYGEPDGLCGVNCRHSFFGVDPKLQKPAYSEEELQRMKEREEEKHPYETKDRNGKDIIKYYTKYQATQRMRKLETEMRKSRERAAGFKAAGVNEEYLEEKARYQELRKEYDKFATAMGMKTQYNERVYVDGLGRI